MMKKVYLVEFIGSFIFFTIGAGAICADSFSNGQVGLLGIAIAHGLILAIVISCYGSISGGHFNPAVSIGLAFIGKISFKDAGAYVLAQLIGGVCAGLVLMNVFPFHIWREVNLGSTGLNAGISPGTGVFLEAVMTFFLMTSILMTAVDPRAPKIGGFGIGLTLLVCILLGGPLTGASLNPARSFGPGLVARFWDNHWIYWVGPIFGAILACLLYKFAIEEEK